MRFIGHNAIYLRNMENERQRDAQGSGKKLRPMYTRSFLQTHRVPKLSDVETASLEEAGRTYADSVPERAASARRAAQALTDLREER